MPLTPNSTTVAYAQPTDLFNYYDLRTIADLVNDQGVRTGGSPNPNPSTLALNPVLLANGMRASGLLESACMRSNRYAVSDLSAVNGASQQFLIGLVCDLWMGLLYRRRPDKGKPPASYGEALKWLEQLADGEAIFSFAETEAAGLPLATVDTPYQIWERSLVAQEAFRYFGWTGDLLRLYGPCGVGPSGPCGSYW
jgi:hypothetical protein